LKAKKISRRTCIGCGEIRSKQDLIRIVRTPDKEVVLDVSGKANGRGSYICYNIDCFKKMKVHGSLSRSLDIAIEPDKMEQLEEVFKENL